MTARTIILALLFVSQDHPGAIPVPKDGGWLKRHEGFVSEARKGGIDLLLLGYSITDAWRGPKQKGIWDEYFAPLKAANFGISGDRTQHVLWRIMNGELEGIRPKVVMLMIGTNNIGQKNPEPPASAVSGIKAIVKEIHSRCPGTKVLLLGVFPRGERPDNPLRAQINEINKEIAALDDGGKTVKFLDIGDKFLQPDGTISRDVMPDFLHLTEKGYKIWADAVKQPLAALMSNC